MSFVQNPLWRGTWCFLYEERWSFWLPLWQGSYAFFRITATCLWWSVIKFSVGPFLCMLKRFCALSTKMPLLQSLYSLYTFGELSTQNWRSAEGKYTLKTNLTTSYISGGLVTDYLLQPISLTNLLFQSPLKMLIKFSIQKLVNH